MNTTTNNTNKRPHSELESSIEVEPPAKRRVPNLQLGSISDSELDSGFGHVEIRPNDSSEIDSQATIEDPTLMIEADPVDCVGCLYDEPGQLAHMEPGGCLYSLDASGDPE